MAGITISEKTYKEIENIAYDHRTNRKDIADKMVEFVIRRKTEFVKEMF